MRRDIRGAWHPHPTLAIMGGKVGAWVLTSGYLTADGIGHFAAWHPHPTLTILRQNAVTSTNAAPKIAKVG